MGKGVGGTGAGLGVGAGGVGGVGVGVGVGAGGVGAGVGGVGPSTGTMIKRWLSKPLHSHACKIVVFSGFSTAGNVDAHVLAVRSHGVEMLEVVFDVECLIIGAIMRDGKEFPLAK